MALIYAAIYPKKFPKGTASFVENEKSKILNGFKMPPPPIPPAFARIMIKNRFKNPKTWRNERGRVSEWNAIAVDTEDISVEFVSIIK